MTSLVSIKEYKGSGISSFDCGETALNSFLTECASQNEKKGVGRTYLLVENEEIIGYFTLSAAEIRCDSLSDKQKKGLPRYPIPAIRIARFAIDCRFRGKGYGKTMMRYALTKCVSVALNVGVVFVIVDAKPNAISFFRRFGFEKIIGTVNTYAVSISTIGKAIGLTV